MKIKFNRKINLTPLDVDFINNLSEKILFPSLENERGIPIDQYRVSLLAEFSKNFPGNEIKFKKVKKIIFYCEPPQIQFRTI